jgi:membrane fusion protein, heavy metal efflux system
MKGLALLCALLFATGCSRNAPPAQPAAQSAPQRAASREVMLDSQGQREAGIVIETAAVRSLPQNLEATGRITVNENRTWRIGSITEGRIIRVLANAGDTVKEGQILARMHSHDIHESRATYRMAVAEVARLKAAESYSLRARDRARRLLELKAASLEQVERAETELRNAQTATENAEVELDRARRHLVEFLEISPDEPKDHRSGLEETDDDLIPIKAPAAGTLLSRSVTTGTVVTTSGDLFLVSDLSVLWMIAAVNEEYLAKLREGMPVRISVMAYPGHAFEGKITKLGEELDPTTRAVQVRVELPNSNGLLKPEMYATAEILLDRSKPALFVPQPAIQEVNGASSVFVAKGDDRFEARTVRMGRSLGDETEILGGLQPGERIVTAGSYVLKSQLLKSSMGAE